MTISLTTLGLILITVGLAQKYGCLFAGGLIVGFSIVMHVLGEVVANLRLKQMKAQMQASYRTH